MANKKLKNFEYANQTTQGQIPQVNTDRVSFFECINGSVFVITDGRGADETGIKASQLASERIKYYLENEFVEKPWEAVYNALIYANGFIFEQARKDPDIEAMGVSCSCLVIRDNLLYYASIGHSRIYYFNGRRLFLVSQGQSLSREMDSSATKTDDSNDSLVPLLGISGRIEPDVNIEPLVPVDGDMILMTSDGMYNAVHEKSIQKILHDPMPSQTKIYRLLDLANLQGGDDNISAQLITFYNLESAERKFVPIKSKQTTKEETSRNVSYYYNELKSQFDEWFSQPVYRIVLVVVAVLLLSYMFYDIFLYNPRPVKNIPREKPATQISEEVADDEPASEDVADNNLPEDIVYVVRPGDTWGRVYSEFGVCSWFIINHPENANKFDSSQNPVAGRQIHIPVSYSSKQALNPDFYQEFSLGKTGSRCENANEEFLRNFHEQLL